MHAQKFPGTVGTLGAVGAARLRSPAPRGGCLPAPGLVSVHSRQGSPGHGSQHARRGGQDPARLLRGRGREGGWGGEEVTTPPARGLLLTGCETPTGNRGLARAGWRGCLGGRWPGLEDGLGSQQRGCREEVRARGRVGADLPTVTDPMVPTYYPHSTGSPNPPCYPKFGDKEDSERSSDGLKVALPGSGGPGPGGAAWGSFTASPACSFSPDRKPGQLVRAPSLGSRLDLTWQAASPPLSSSGCRRSSQPNEGGFGGYRGDPARSGRHTAPFLRPSKRKSLQEQEGREPAEGQGTSYPGGPSLLLGGGGWDWGLGAASPLRVGEGLHLFSQGP